MQIAAQGFFQEEEDLQDTHCKSASKSRWCPPHHGWSAAASDVARGARGIFAHLVPSFFPCTDANRFLGKDLKCLFHSLRTWTAARCTFLVPEKLPAILFGLQQLRRTSGDFNTGQPSGQSASPGSYQKPPEIRTKGSGPVWV
ncbi:unnamed protein product [Symbiodinium natans]|uniref:Uncharacterized protein n=1 Tax=Symbiodinium natans TaxID=878477 RepID=A0A812VB85_9DINO|nr:unnamed protein product [Symbiodinium natans]